jgi:cell fate regulator YaaT (PSP1 superfamily)
MCCLKYEEEHYTNTRKRMPAIGKTVHTPDGEGVVNDINILKETIKVHLNPDNDDSVETRVYHLDDIQKTRKSTDSFEDTYDE